MKNFMLSVVDFLKSAVTAAIFGVLYIIFSAAVAIPYTFLARGDAHNLYATTLIGPVVVVMLTFAASMCWAIRSKEAWLVFLALVIYVCLPILLSGLSLLIGSFGYETAANIIFKVRYMSLLLIPLSVFVILAAWGAAERFIGHRREQNRNAAPPSNPGGPSSGYQPPSQQPNGGNEQLLRTRVSMIP